MTVQDDAMLERALAPVRARFIGALEGHILSFEALKKQAARDENAQPALDEIGKLAHRISGLAGSVGFDEIGELAGRVERSVITSRTETAPSARKLASVTAELEPLLDLLESRLDD